MTNRAATLVALVVFPLAAPPSGVAAAPAQTPAVSPSKVLAALGAGAPQRTGQFYLPNSPADSVDTGADRSLAPYLYVAGGDPETERLPLRETSARVDVAGVIARARVHQVFENGGKRPIEAVYVFPASTRAAVHGMRMKVGDRVIEAHIDRRQAAREDYEAARAQGRRASLLEQERANVFTMNVANVMPGDRIEVELDYSELLVPEDAVYELVFPAVVGPRYAGHADPQREVRNPSGGSEVDHWMANPHLPAGQPAPYRFDVAVHLETGVALKAVSSPSHDVDVRYASPSSADITLRAPGQGGDRDYVLRYRLAEDRIETGLLLSPPEAGGEGFFALMMEPPRNPAPAQIPGREYVFLLDVSGSMHGFPLDTAKALMRKLLGQLRPTDKFDLALFSGANYVMSPKGSVAATPANISSAVELVERQTGGGGTELMGGLEAAYGIPRGPQGMSRTVVVVTDGYVGVEAQAFRFIRERLGEANLFAFGIGTSVNRALIEGMARAGQGEPFVVLRPEKAAAEAEKLRAMIAEPVLTHVAVAFDGFGAAEVSPANAKIPDLLARRPLVVFGKWSGRAVGRIRVSGIGGGGTPFARAIEVRAEQQTPRNEALRWLWARSWVSTLDDERHMGGGKPVEDAITDLGLRYSLLTSFTSFVAVDKEIANRSGQVDTVRQPLPMPAGVSNLAVEAAASTGAGSGGQGFGVLGGKRKAHAVAEEAEAPAPPASPAPVAQRASSGARDKDDARVEKKPAKKEEGPAILVRAAGASGLGDTAPLREAIVARLRGGAACSVHAVEVVLRLTVDAAGKVIAVERVSGDGAAAACLRAKLVGLASATRATGSKPGLWTVTLRVG